MHELSMATEVIELAQREAGKNGLSFIEEIRIEVGDLSGIEADVFHSALEMVVKDTLLENARVQILRTPGKGNCGGCNLEFVMKNRLDVCPLCGCFPAIITGGQEFRVISITGD